ncbi:hypothetical protein F4811DRAFT_501108 [Daldinia bambusicola]|nr:hypothetical protein F4811DRAFT_501108 [Daldinia bambusicola]
MIKMCCSRARVCVRVFLFRMLNKSPVRSLWAGSGTFPLFSLLLRFLSFLFFLLFFFFSISHVCRTKRERERETHARALGAQFYLPLRIAYAYETESYNRQPIHQTSLFVPGLLTALRGGSQIGQRILFT